MKSEHYYAVRIDSPVFPEPYLMLGPDGKTPRLFNTREEAEPSATGHSVVPVEIRVRTPYGEGKEARP